MFCLRLADADGVLKVSCKDLKDKSPFQHIKSDKIRYSSQNLNAVPKFGSIEYRGMRGVTDPVIIDTWSDELYKMVTSSKKYSDPADLMDKFANLDKKDFLKSLFSNSFVDTLITIPNWRALMDADVGRLIELGYFHDWTQYSEKIEKNRLNNRINEKAVLQENPVVPYMLELTPTQVRKAWMDGLPLRKVELQNKYYVTAQLDHGIWEPNFDDPHTVSDDQIREYLASHGLLAQAPTPPPAQQWGMNTTASINLDQFVSVIHTMEDGEL
jgi:hypothetical protein